MERWDKINTVQHMQDYIKDHIEDYSKRTPPIQLFMPYILLHTSTNQE